MFGADKDGYWKGENLIQQVQNTCDIAEVKYPTETHTYKQLPIKNDKKALPAKNVLAKDGGPHRVHDTVWVGRKQKMVLPDRTA